MMKCLLAKGLSTGRLDETVASIGNFDGVHLGHKALFAQLRAQALTMNLSSCVVLFEPQPCEFFSKQQAPARLTSLREKLALIKQAELDYAYCLRFNEKLAAMPPEVFAEHIIFSQLNIKWLLVGEDFRFGKGRRGDVDLLIKLGARYDCKVVSFPDFVLQNSRVSSTLIRQTLAQKRLKQAAILLGRPYSVSGRVSYGQGLGRQWGIPTANIGMSRRNLPFTGIFCVSVKRANGLVLKGVASLGTRPTVGGTKTVLEVNLFDFSGNLYGERLEVSFLHHLRDEEHFSSVDELIHHIHQDIRAAKDYFEANSVIA